MSKTEKIFLLLNLVLVIGYINWAVAVKEKTLRNGKLLLLELAPVDPRSLMQGDYMRLDYQINRLPEETVLDKRGTTTIGKRGYCILKTDSSGVAQRIRFQPDIQPLGAEEIAVKYYSNGNRSFTRIHIGAASYFFEEGSAKKYEPARFGGLKIDAEGNTVLVGLYDVNRKLL
ncbi:GDYXXLXY domain-containing protein [Pedobacter heparinus]|uniref:GDYXXLXY domain-containing protein n=1 Tax=Pedobacter heparinus TaxID=984 RepID=UPI00292E9644|nr:GDYXXLXY domain-containing protein [Pedobacter heparinus]